MHPSDATVVAKRKGTNDIKVELSKTKAKAHRQSRIVPRQCLQSQRQIQHQRLMQGFQRCPCIDLGPMHELETNSRLRKLPTININCKQKQMPKVLYAQSGKVEALGMSNLRNMADLIGVVTYSLAEGHLSQNGKSIAKF